MGVPGIPGLGWLWDAHLTLQAVTPPLSSEPAPRVSAAASLGSLLRRAFGKHTKMLRPEQTSCCHVCAPESKQAEGGYLHAGWTGRPGLVEAVIPTVVGVPEAGHRPQKRKKAPTGQQAGALASSPSGGRAALSLPSLWWTRRPSPQQTLPDHQKPVV